MGAEAFGTQLLAQVKTASLADILRALYKAHNPSTLGLPALDDTLALLRNHHHPSNRPYTPTVEITSLSSGDGKTALLYYITALAVLPTTHHGHGAAVIWLDTDGRFDAARVRVVMQRILQTQGNVTVDDTGDLLSEALQHIHVFRPVSSAALLATLRSIPEYLLTCHDDGRTGQPQHYSRNRRVHSLVLDSATAFLWQDRWAAALARIPGGAEDERERSHFATGDNASDGTGRGGNLHADIVTWLREFQEQFSCMLLYTTTMTTGRSGLPYPWPVLPVLRVMVRRDAVQRFGGEMSVEAARADAEARQSVVRRGRCSGWVDLSSVPASVRQEIETRGMGVFSFRIDDRGVEIDI